MFLPETFSGLVQLKSRKGRFQILPELAAVMTMVKQGDEEVLFLVGNQATSGPIIDFCQLESRCGDLVVGLYGFDLYEKPVGFWRRLFGCRA